MFEREGFTATCGFAMCVPPPEDAEYGAEYGIMAFLFVWCSGWNFACSKFVFLALARLRAEWSKGALCQLVVSLVIPHVAIGLVLPYFMGGLVWELIAVWPYYYRSYQLFTSKQGLSAGAGSPPEVESAPHPTAASAMPAVVCMHTTRDHGQPVVLAQAVSTSTRDQGQPVVLAQAVSTNTCPNCGYLFGDSSCRFCPVCGTPAPHSTVVPAEAVPAPASRAGCLPTVMATAVNREEEQEEEEEDNNIV